MVRRPAFLRALPNLGPLLWKTSAAAAGGTWVHTWGCNMPMALCWQMLYCGPLSRAIFRLLFRRGEKKAA